MTTDVPFSRRLLVERAVGLGEIVGQVAMELHVYFRNVEPGGKGNPYDILPLIASARSFRDEALHRFLGACEWVMRWMVWEPLNGAGFGEELKVTGGDARFGANGEDLGWQRVQKELAEQATPNIGPDQDYLCMVEVFLDHLRALLHGIAPYFTTTSEWTCNKWVHESACGLLGRESPSPPLAVRSAGLDYEKRPVWKVHGPFPALLATADWASAELLDVLRSLHGRSVAARGLLIAEVPTFGIFVPSVASEVDRQLFRWADERDVPRELTLPGRPRGASLPGRPAPGNPQAPRAGIGSRR